MRTDHNECSGYGPIETVSIIIIDDVVSIEHEFTIRPISYSALVYRQSLGAVQGGNSLRIPVQNLTPGLYLLQLRTANQVLTVKFSKEYGPVLGEPQRHQTVP